MISTGRFSPFFMTGNGDWAGGNTCKAQLNGYDQTAGLQVKDLAHVKSCSMNLGYRS